MEDGLSDNRERFSIGSNGAKVFITDVREFDGFRGKWWVEVAISGTEFNTVTVDHYRDRDGAEEKAQEVTDALEIEQL